MDLEFVRNGIRPYILRKMQGLIPGTQSLSFINETTLLLL